MSSDASNFYIKSDIYNKLNKTDTSIFECKLKNLISMKRKVMKKKLTLQNNHLINILIDLMLGEIDTNNS